MWRVLGKVTDALTLSHIGPAAPSLVRLLALLSLPQASAAQTPAMQPALPTDVIEHCPARSDGCSEETHAYRGRLAPSPTGAQPVAAPSEHPQRHRRAPAVP